MNRGCRPLFKAAGRIVWFRDATFGAARVAGRSFRSSSAIRSILLVKVDSGVLIFPVEISVLQDSRADFRKSGWRRCSRGQREVSAGNQARARKTLRTLRAGGAGWSGNALGTRCSRITFRSLRTNCASCTSVAFRSLWSGLTLRSLRARVPLRAAQAFNISRA